MLELTDLKPEHFEQFVLNHRSADHEIFSVVEAAAVQGSLTRDQYSLFAKNIAARTMMSLSEIHACCIQASLDLDPLRTAYGVLTGAEEGGFGRPTKVHSVLMMNALNTHGRVVFASEPINLRRLMALVRLIHAANRYRSLLEINALYPGALDLLNTRGIINATELSTTVRRMLDYLEIRHKNTNPPNLKSLNAIEAAARHQLHGEMILPATLDYCLQQMDVLGNALPGYLQGVGYAHEALADGMLYRMFRIMYAQVDRYPSEQEFTRHVYPYYAAHGNYLDIFRGKGGGKKGIEQIHAERELAKLSELDKESLGNAWSGAKDFAARNVRIWDDMLNHLNGIPAQHRPFDAKNPQFLV
jgi:hypothetical protein